MLGCPLAAWSEAVWNSFGTVVRVIRSGGHDGRELSNPNGYTQNLVPAHPGNQNRLVHGVYSERLREPRAQEIFEAIIDAPHVVPLDAIAARNIGRLEALIEACHGEIERAGVTRGGKVRALVDLELRAIRRQLELLDRFGLDSPGAG